MNGAEDVRDGYGVGMWKAIRNGWESAKIRSHFMAMEKGPNFRKIDCVET